MSVNLRQNTTWGSKSLSYFLAFLRFDKGLCQQSPPQETGAYPIELTGWLLVVGGYITHNWLLVGCGKSSPWGKVKDALLRKNKVPQSLGHAGFNFDLNPWSLS